MLLCSMYLVFSQILLDPQRRISLEEEHETVFNRLREYDKSGTDSTECELTVITSIILKDDGQPMTDIFLIKGIVLDSGCKDLMRLEEKETSGWMVTTRWITSEALHNILERKWCEVNSSISHDKDKSKHNGITRVGLMKLDTMSEGCPDIDVAAWKGFNRRLNVTITSSHSKISYQHAKNHFALSTLDKRYMGTSGEQKYSYHEKKVVTKVYEQMWCLVKSHFSSMSTALSSIFLCLHISSAQFNILLLLETCRSCGDRM